MASPTLPYADLHRQAVLSSQEGEILFLSHQFTLKAKLSTGFIALRVAQLWGTCQNNANAILSHLSFAGQGTVVWTVRVRSSQVFLDLGRFRRLVQDLRCNHLYRNVRTMM